MAPYLLLAVKTLQDQSQTLEAKAVAIQLLKNAGFSQPCIDAWCKGESDINQEMILYA